MSSSFGRNDINSIDSRRPTQYSQTLIFTKSSLSVSQSLSKFTCAIFEKLPYLLLCWKRQINFEFYHQFPSFFFLLFWKIWTKTSIFSLNHTIKVDECVILYYLILKLCWLYTLMTKRSFYEKRIANSSFINKLLWFAKCYFVFTGG